MPTEQVRGAVAALQAFVDANARRDDVAMLACLTRASRESGGFSGSTPPGIEFQMGEPEPGDGNIIIPLNVVSTEAPGGEPLDTLRCIMVEEDGQWKFDLLSTMQPMMEMADAAMREAMEQVGDAMGQALGAVGDAMADAFGSSSDDAATSAFTGEPLTLSTWEDAPDLPTDAEWIPLPDLHTLPTISAAVREALGREVPIRADVGSILAVFNAEDPAPLIPWLDNDFPQGLAAALELATRVVPVEAARLRSVRIETSRDWRDRSLSLDGPDLVYRIDPRDTEGWYSGDELAQIIPGVLAGLPASAHAYPADRGALPSAEPLPTIDILRDVRAPREMRRLSRKLGGVVALDVDWANLWDSPQMIRNWCIWGLPRVLGALGLAYPEGSAAPPEGLIRVVRISIGHMDRSAALENGVLDLVISPMQGEKSCLYEYELCAAILGQPFSDGAVAEAPADPQAAPDLD